jgi:hypothetical protein
MKYYMIASRHEGGKTLALGARDARQSARLMGVKIRWAKRIGSIAVAAPRSALIRR